MNADEIADDLIGQWVGDVARQSLDEKSAYKLLRKRIAEALAAFGGLPTAERTVDVATQQDEPADPSYYWGKSRVA